MGEIPDGKIPDRGSSSSSDTWMTDPIKVPWKWERLDTMTYRAKVIGGWLVTIQPEEGSCQAESMVFVSDGTHQWEIA